MRMLVAVSLFFAFSAHAANELKIGYLSTLSGPAGAIGVEIRDGFNLALKMAGGKLGGLPTEVIFADDTLNPETGKQLAERLLKRDRVNLMTGVVFSNVMIAVWPTIQQAKVVYVAPNSTPTSITGAGCNPYFVSAAWPNEGHREAAGHYAKSKGYKNVYLIAPNYPAGKDSTTGFKRGYGGTIAAEVYTKLNQLDYSAELAQIRAAKPAALYAFLPGGMGINFVKQFVAGFEKEYKRIPSLFAEQGYTTALLIDAAVRSVKGKIEDMPAFHKALMAAPGRFKSPRGDFKMAHNGTPVQDYYLRVVAKDNQGRLVNKKIATVVNGLGDYWAKDCKMK